MPRNYTYTVLVALGSALLFAAANRATAQALCCAHHSTAFGDYMGGAADVIRAQGAYNLDTAAAAESWARAVAAQDAIQYQRAEYRFQVAQMELESRLQKLAQRRQEQQDKLAADAAAARQFGEQARRGLAEWPAALSRPEFSASMSLVQSVLRNWSLDDSPRGDASRQALATEVGVLRSRVAQDKDIDFTSRVNAVKTLDELKLLARMSGTVETGSGLAMR